MTTDGAPGAAGDQDPARAWDPSDPAVAQLIADTLGLIPLPAEGGLFRQIWADGISTAIYFLVSGADFSAMHRLSGPEVYHFYAGAPLRLLLLDDATGVITEPVLGLDLLAGQRPQLAVPAGIWQGSSSTGEWSLVGTTMAPPFAWENFQLGDRGVLCAQFPGATARITRLTR